MVPGGRRDLYHFAPFEALAPASFGNAEWVDLDGRTVYGVLYASR